MEESLKKLIKRVILPKYPWITDFNVIDKEIGEFNRYSVHYYVNYDRYYNPGEFGAVKSDTKTLYNVLGPSPSDSFEGTAFRDYED
jgi:hypothetical protein